MKKSDVQAQTQPQQGQAHAQVQPESQIQAQAPKVNRSIWNLWGLFGSTSASSATPSPRIIPATAINTKAEAPANVVEAEVDEGILVEPEMDAKAAEEAYENQVVQHYRNEEQDQKAFLESIRQEAKKEAEQRTEQALKEAEIRAQQTLKEAELRAQQAYNARLQELETRLKAKEEENVRLKAAELLQKENEIKQKQEEARLKKIEAELKEKEARILAQVKETAQKLSDELEEKNRIEDKILREKMDAQKANNAAPDDALDAEILAAIERRKGRKALLVALQAIANDPKTIVKPKPEINKHIYPEHAPFTEKEKWVDKLPKGYVQNLNETVRAIIDLNDPFNAKFEDLMRTLKLSAAEMAKLQLEIEVHDLDSEFGMATRRKRVLNGQYLLSSQESVQSGSNQSHREEGEIMFGAKKGQQAVVLKFDSVERGSYRIREVTAENIKDFQANIVENQGIVVKGKKEGDGTTLYNTTRKRKAAVHI